MVHMQLSPGDATFLCDQLKRQMERLEDELVHTDKRGMQRDIAHDVDHLRAVLNQIERVIALPDQELVQNAASR